MGLNRKSIRVRALVITVATIALSLSGTLPHAAGEPIPSQDQPEQAKDPPSPAPEPSQSAPVAIPSSSESSGPAGLSGQSLCDEIASTARQHKLPTQFFTGLIWQESRFNPASVSRAGAQGIAQFMPATARSRNLSNPFEPFEALHEAARLLDELRTEFGNVGLAAAAYNAGPRRVREWLAGVRHLPAETRAYVQTVTGRRVEEWNGSEVSDSAAVPSESTPCGDMTGPITERQARLPAEKPASISQSPMRERTVATPWGLQLIGEPSQVRALSAYRVLQERFPDILGHRDPLVLRTPPKGPASWFRVRVAETTLQRANTLCERLKKAGGTCLVQRNPLADTPSVTAGR